MAATPEPTDLAVPTTTEGVRELLKRAAKGDAATLPAVRKLLERPGYVDWLGGNLAATAEAAFVKALAGDDLAVREALHAKLAGMRRDLAGDRPTPVEGLLAGRVAACWLQVQDAEVRYAAAQKELTIRQADFHQRRMDAANRRYLAAIKALAVVRRLAVPALQVNIAREQVNVVAPAPPVTTG